MSFTDNYCCALTKKWLESTCGYITVRLFFVGPVVLCLFLAWIPFLHFLGGFQLEESIIVGILINSIILTLCMATSLIIYGLYLFFQSCMESKKELDRTSGSKYLPIVEEE